MQNVDYDDSTFETFFANPPAGLELDALDRTRIPRHVSCIMDGNGRWATSRGLGRGEGHKAGIVSLREIITACVRLGVEVLSAYAFSTENWKRPKQEVNLLMYLFAQTFVDELPLLKRENVRVVFPGRHLRPPGAPARFLNTALRETSTHTGMVLALAVNYGARAELARAARLLAEDVAAGRLDPSQIDEAAVAGKLYTAGLPDPELIIRTSGELRLSNYLLWQAAYSEFYITRTYWPDFNRWELLDAVLSFQGRDRRFGGIHEKEA